MAKLTFTIAHEDTDTYTDIELSGTLPDETTATKQLKLFKTFLVAQEYIIDELAIIEENGKIRSSTED